jgi:hypothetical protein
MLLPSRALGIAVRIDGRSGIRSLRPGNGSSSRHFEGTQQAFPLLRRSDDNGTLDESDAMTSRKV